MATYATAADFKALFPEEECVQLTNLDNPGAIAAIDTRITNALADAQTEIDSYVGVVADLPLLTTPLVLKNAAVRIARYRLDSYSPRDSVRRDYEDVVKWLEKVAEGKVSLGVDAGGTEQPPEQLGGGVAYTTAGRVFTASTLRGYQGFDF